MASRNFQKLGHWFPYSGKTMVVSPSYADNADPENPDSVDLYLFMTNIAIDTLEADFYPEDLGRAASLVGKLEGVTVISDIPSGVFLFLTDKEDGSEVSSSYADHGCYITSCDSEYRG